MSEPDFSLSRRELLGTAMAVSLGAMLTARATGEAATQKIRIVDTNVNLFQWPFRRLPLDDPRRLVDRLNSLGIALAWASSFEALLHRDITGVNERLAETCREFPELVAIGAVNLSLPDWEHDFQRCVEKHNMPGIRLLPNYHGYPLSDPRFAAFLKLATDAGRFVQIAVSLEDVRTQHALVQVADVDLTPLPAVIQQIPGARIALLNARPRSPLLEQLADTPGVYLDIARVDGTDGISSLLRSFPANRVLLGTHAPFLIPEATLIRVDESDLNEVELRRLLWENAGALWTKS